MFNIDSFKEFKLNKQKFALPVGSKKRDYGTLIILNTSSHGGNDAILNAPLINTMGLYKQIFTDGQFRSKIGPKTISERKVKERLEYYRELKDSHSLKGLVVFNTNPGKNLYYEISHWNELFFQIMDKKPVLTKAKAYMQLLSENILNQPFFSHYEKKIMVFDLDDWGKTELRDYNNPLGLFYFLMRKHLNEMEILNGIDILITTKDACFRFKPENLDERSFNEFYRLMVRLNKTIFSEEMEKEEGVVNPLSQNQVPDADPLMKPEEGTELVKHDDRKMPSIDSKEEAPHSTEPLKFPSEEEEQEEKAKIDDLIKSSALEPVNIKSTAMSKRDEELRKAQLELKIEGLKNGTLKLEDLRNIHPSEIEISTKDISKKVNVLDKNFTKVKFSNFAGEYVEKLYDKDIVSIADTMQDKSIPVYIREVTKEDTSDPMTAKETWTFSLEDSERRRHTLKFDVPKFIEGKYMMINGNKKVFNNQRVMKPLVKTAPDTVQVCTTYNKIFMTRYGENVESIYEKFRQLVLNNKAFKVVQGNCSKTNAEYKTSIEYDTLAKTFVEIIVDIGRNNVKRHFVFNQPLLKKMIEKDGTEKAKEIYERITKDDNIALFVDYQNGKIVFVGMLKPDLGTTLESMEKIPTMEAYHNPSIILAEDPKLVDKNWAISRLKQHTFEDGKTKKVLFHNGKRYRLRSEILVFDENGKVFVQPLDTVGTMGAMYKLPGGGVEKNERSDIAAARECNEEARLRVENVLYSKIAYVKLYNGSSPREQDLQRYYDGALTFVFVAKCTGKFKGYVKKEDREDDMVKYGNFFDPRDLPLTEPHIEAVNAYHHLTTGDSTPIIEAVTEEPDIEEDNTKELEFGVIDLILTSLPDEKREPMKKEMASYSAGKRFMFTRCKVMKKNIPLVIFLAYCEGLTTVLRKAKILHHFTEKRPNLKEDALYRGVIQFSDGYLIYDKFPLKNSILMNGLYGVDTKNYEYAEFDQKDVYMEALAKICGNRMIASALDNFYDWMIDPVTREILEDLNYPTDFVGLMLAGNELLQDNNYRNELDMANWRVRSNEMVYAHAYKRIADAYTKYRATADNKNPVKISIPRDAVMKDIAMSQIVEDVSELSPIVEVEKARSITDKGPSGTNLEQAYTMARRCYHPSMKGIIAMSTSVDANVGISRDLTLEPNITNLRGYVAPDEDQKFNAINMFSPAEMLTPLAGTHDDTIRTATGTKQSKHIIPVDHSSPVLMSTGMEKALPYHLSSDFVVVAKDDGEVVEYDMDKGVVVLKYKDGSTQAINANVKVVKNGAGGFFLPSKMNCSKLKKGYKFKKDDVLAYNDQFFSSSKSEGVRFNIGTLSKVACIGSYANFEDGDAVTVKLSKKMGTRICMETHAVVGLHSNVDFIVKVGDHVEVGDPLITYDQSSGDPGFNKLLANIGKDMQEEIKDMGKTPIKSHYEGTIRAIKIYSTVDPDELSPSLKKIVTAYYKEIGEKKKLVSKHKDKKDTSMDYTFMEEDKKIETEDGKVLGITVGEGVLIKFYIEYQDNVDTGDKLVHFAALKGITGEVIPEGQEPFTLDRPEEEISSTFGPAAILARMVPSAMTTMYGNKIIIEVKRKLMEMYQKDNPSFKPKDELF